MFSTASLFLSSLDVFFFPPFFSFISLSDLSSPAPHIQPLRQRFLHNSVFFFFILFCSLKTVLPVSLIALFKSCSFFFFCLCCC